MKTNSLRTLSKRVRYKLEDIIENFLSYKIVYFRKDFPMFWPNSAGSTKVKKRIAFETLDGIFVSLARFSNYEVISVEKFRELSDPRIEYGKLDQLLRLYGSDKSISHDYEKIYEVLFSNCEAVTKVFEVGIGSPNLKIISNMGSDGKPGASLRAFRDFFPNAEIIGADIDKEILYSEERISTYYLNQLHMESFVDLSKSAGSGFDLVIDDGLHAIDANLNVLYFFIPLLKQGGYAVIEDIPKAATSFWLMMIDHLKDSGDSWLIDTKGGLLFVFKKNL
jgi:hypothetical protein